jgi:GAF domain-containing protein
MLAVPVLAGAGSAGLAGLLGKPWGLSLSPRKAPVFYVLLGVGMGAFAGQRRDYRLDLAAAGGVGQRGAVGREHRRPAPVGRLRRDGRLAGVLRGQRGSDLLQRLLLGVDAQPLSLDAPLGGHSDTASLADLLGAVAARWGELPAAATLIRMAATVEERLAQVFVELADTLVAGFDLMEFLQTLTERCVELLGVDAAGLLLADSEGALRLVAASTEQARVMELFQIQNDEGPCLDCYRTGQVVTISDIGAQQAVARWPRFAAAARDVGFAGVHAIPMRLRDQVIGTLNLFRGAVNGLDPAVARAARALVDVATIGILQERAVHQQEVVATQLQNALNSRVMIEQAKGILAERLQATPDEAFVLLRRYARDHNHPLTQLAGDVIRGTAPIVRASPPAPHPRPGEQSKR